MPRVLMCGPVSSSGGVAVHTKNIMRHLSTSGTQVLFFSFTGANIQILNNISKILRRTVGLVFVALKKRKEYDIIHVQSSGGFFSFISAITACIISKIIDKKVVVTFHFSNTRDFVKKHKGSFSFVLKRLNCLILVSNGQKEAIIKYFPQFSDKIVVIPNGYDSNLFYPRPMDSCRKLLGVPLDTKIIVNLSNLIETKGHKYLIEAMNYVLECRDDVICYIIGRGPLEKKLQSDIENLNLQNHVKILGWKPDEEIPLWMSSSDLFVFPSLKESFGMVQIEAMACGKPVVATINGGSEGIITSDKYGILCEAANSKELSENIIKALKKSWNQEDIIQYNKQFTWENIVQKTVSIYNKI